MDDAKKILIADALKRIVDTARQGGPTVRIGLMAWGSDLGEAEIIAGGLLTDKKDVMAALEAGADAVSTTSVPLWSV